VDEVHAFVIPLKVPDVAQIQVTQDKAPVAVVVRSNAAANWPFLCSLRRV
jgi:hypothetical protein